MIEQVELGIPSADIEMQGIINMGLNYIYAHPEVIDEIFRPLLAPHLARLYGQKEIDKIRKFITERKIRVVQAYAAGPEQLPCYAIEVISEDEDIGKAFLADEAGQTDRAISPTVIVRTFTPQSVASSSDGTIMIVPGGVSLAPAYPGQIAVDAAGRKFPIIVPVGDDFITIDDNAEGDWSSCRIQSAHETQRDELKATGSWETVRVGIHSAPQPNVVMWMATILRWIGLKFKPEMEKRGVELTTFSVSPLQMEPALQTEQVYSRFFTCRMRLISAWRGDEIPNIDAFAFDFFADPLDSNEGTVKLQGE